MNETKTYRVTASAVGSYYYTDIAAGSAAEALELAAGLPGDYWEYELGDPEMDLSDLAAEEAGA
jgi:hypothetical protein